MGQDDNYYIKDHLNYTSSPQTRPGWKRRYDFVLQYIRKPDTVLDCACGLGEGTNMLAQNCAKAIGVDIDTHFIDYCRTAWPALEFHNNDAAKGLPFSDGQFDVVVSIETIEHLPSLDMVHKALNNFKRVLKPGGLCIVSVPNAVNAAPLTLSFRFKLLLLRFFGTMYKKQARWHEHYRLWDAQRFGKLLQQFFSVVSVYGEWPEGFTTETSRAPYLIAHAKK